MRILLIEDNPGDAFLVQEALLDYGSRQIEMSHFQRLEDGLKWSGVEDVDVILLDLSLPDAHGLEGIIRTQTVRPNLPIVVLTSLDDEAVAIEAAKAGAEDYLIKGQIDANLLMRALRYAIERKRVEEALRIKTEEMEAMSRQLWQTSKLATMGELSASIAHELNNPLATVSLRVESLLMQVPEDDPKRRALNIIEQEVERMSRLVSNLLNFSRRGLPQISTVDLREEIENTLDLIHYHLKKCRVEVEKQYAPGVERIQADRQQLRQPFLNVVINAADAMSQGGTLTIRTSSHRLSGDESCASIELADTGTGIVSDDLSKVTEPFFTTKPQGQGTGLGLAICKRIVEGHKGRLEISSSVGKGTTVRIILPDKYSTSGLRSQVERC